MKGRIKFFYVLALVTCIIISLGTFFFACIHFSNWWSLFIYVPIFFSVCVPSVCYEFKRADDLLDVQMPREDFQNCRELGRAIALLLLLVSYSVPVLAWYNSGFHWMGVLLIMTTILLTSISFIIWKRVFVDY
jgi:hypothetical protein